MGPRSTSVATASGTMHVEHNESNTLRSPALANTIIGEALKIHISATPRFLDYFVSPALERRNLESRQCRDEFRPGDSRYLRCPLLRNMAKFIPFDGRGQTEFPGESCRILLYRGKRAIRQLKSQLDHSLQPHRGKSPGMQDCCAFHPMFIILPVTCPKDNMPGFVHTFAQNGFHCEDMQGIHYAEKARAHVISPGRQAVRIQLIT